MAERIGLALSGGGLRAMVFHAGVLRWLAQKEQLEQVSAISSVSGGTLITGLVLRLNGWRWPNSHTYLHVVLPKIRELLTTVCLERKARALLLYRPDNWRFLFSRANVLAMAMDRAWDIDITLDQLDPSPAWSINGTTAETGRRFRFKEERCGDYELGYAAAKNFTVAQAMAASAAYPLLIGPLRIDAAGMEWFKRPSWGGTESHELAVSSAYRTLHIIDGGVYDNLGMEPFFDIGNQSLKGVDHLIVSDAGAVLERTALPAQWRLRRLSRILEISMDQARALRVRPFVNAILKDRSVGRYYQIGSVPQEKLAQFAAASGARSDGAWLSRQEVERAASWPTNLKVVSAEVFDLIAQHGYETADWNDMAFSQASVV
ncbi:patatin-like phospholipase family protein [Cupriavidus necator]|uniref:patatin-like phospholipase family protein n=1 Tax=Cupriavidus necator TaxID=106590 RepID=UPI00339D873F